MSVIRRKHTANFTTIGNALFEDDRLGADELGVLAFLLSRPHDWEVRRPALARRFGLGKVSIKRIILNLIAFGWIVAQKTRLPNGTYYTVYEVSDHSGPTLTLDQAKAATSLVSEEADDADETDGDEAGGNQGPPTDPPDTTQRGLASEGSQTDPGPIEDSLKTESVKKDSTQQVRAFLDVRNAWPRDHILSDVASQSAFLGLTDAVKEDCYNGVKPYLDDCSAQSRKVCDLATFIRERRWERFKATEKGSGKSSIFKIKSAQWYRWREYKIATGQPVKFMDYFASTRPDGLWSEPSDWPPALPKEDKALATEDELKQFGRTG